MDIKRLSACSLVSLLLLPVPALTESAEAEQEEVQGQSQGQAADEEARDLGRVAVTTRRVEETLQEVPVAVTAFSSEDIRDLQAVQLDDIQGAVPNVNIAQGRASASSVNAFIRGIGQPDALQSFDPGVGIYVDDVYMSRIQGGLFNLFDVERVEVLRGPQGTLYGRNSPAGAIKLVTRTPGEVPEAIAEVGYGDYGRYNGQFYAGGGLGNDWAMSVSGLVTGMDGYVEDPISGRDFNDDDSEALRAKLHYDPAMDFNLTLSWDYTRQRAAATLGQQQEDLIQVDLATGESTVLMSAPEQDFDFRASTNLEPGQGQDLDHWGFSASWDLGLNEYWRMKGISAYRELDTDFWLDFDNSEFSVTESLVALDQSQFSQEFQFHYDGGDNFRAVTGLFYMEEDVPSHQRAIADDAFTFAGQPVDFLRTIDDDLRTTSYAVFGQGTWDFAERWQFSAGARYSRDEKEYFRTTTTYSNVELLEEIFAFEDKDSWSEITPSFSLSYEFDETMMAYGSASRGYKAGGFNGRANAPDDTGAFDPEIVDTYELGLKATFLDGRLLTNWAVFRSDYQDFQARVAEDIDSFPVINAGELRIDGLELEAVAQVADDTQLSMQLGLLDARYKEFFDVRADGADRSDDVVPFSPDMTFRLGLLHDFHLPNGGTLTFSGDTQYRDDTALSVDNQPRLFQEAYWLFNAQARYRTPDARWEVSAGVRNLSDELYKVDAQEFSSVGNIQGAFFGAPRHWMVSLRHYY
ncbi:iron complex outermembrane receptor protein [Natronospira proteinivora]|uniref:Iron complex outermembrane receptor protein n=1 Tax=Natronospira proteinivora TaxID=1807133 RepID=A0ABT1G7E2_9GAMM|nr:TonB-dependent receptor [Natronospira proteinivora]MCP1727221.1 iron complex outermembrane receptor protein [Natronospira proteinivora]